MNLNIPRSLTPAKPPGSATQTTKATVARRRPLNTGRIVIEKVYPELDCGRNPVKRIVGDTFEVSADIFREGHDRLGAALLLRRNGDERWTATPMQLLDNDHWVGRVTLAENRRHFYTVEAWTDLFASWRERVIAKRGASQDLTRELAEGRALAAQAAACATSNAARTTLDHALASRISSVSGEEIEPLLSTEVAVIMAEWGPRTNVRRLDRELPLIVDRPAARFGAWYEMFPRSQGHVPGKSATFKDCIARLDDINAMGFDVVYLVPIHPIGKTNRKGKNNMLAAKPDDPGSPYAIGNEAGGHDAVDPALGTLEDFHVFIKACRARDMEVALDFAVQCSLDHPWIKQHPSWFKFRPDGSIRFAENPPKKYQDIVNLNFDTPDWPEIWQALKDVVQFWIDQGVRIFRVDNPHTKPFPFWEWLIRETHFDHPDVIFLSEAFTRPKPMRLLAKLGFTQSYTYFTWRNDKQELIDYFTELTRGEAREYFRPHLFTNTPDILHLFLQRGGSSAFRIRAALAATLGSLWGIYNGFELTENRALPDSEEYANSEKYEYKVWDWDRPGNIKPYIAQLNRLRRENAAFHDWLNLQFLPVDNPRVLFYMRMPANAPDAVFVAVSLDPFGDQAATIELPLDRLGIAAHVTFAIRNLLTGESLLWTGARQSIWLGPGVPLFAFKMEPRDA